VAPVNVLSCEDFRTPADDERLRAPGWPAFENRQRTKPRGVIRGRAATAYGDLMTVRGGITIVELAHRIYQTSRMTTQRCDCLSKGGAITDHLNLIDETECEMGLRSK
jgi:hypothetical protein